MTFLFRLLSHLPLWVLHGLGWVLGWLAFLGSAAYRQRFLENAAQAGVQRAQWLPAVGEAGRMVAELPRLWLGAPVPTFWDGIEQVDAAMAAQRGIVFLTPHLGCFEVMGQAYTQRYGGAGNSMTVLFRPPRKAWLRDVVGASRQRPGLDTAPTTLAGTVGTAWAVSNNAIVATEGTSPYRFAVTSGLLPSGLALSAANGQITGIPAANTGGSYAVTVTATDSANIPVSDSVIFKLSIAGGLVLATTGTSPYSVTYGAGNASVTTASATGGIYPYVFAITAPATPPVGMTVNPATGLVGVSALTPAGTYHVTITATDSTTSTPLTGSATFDIVVALSVVNTAPTAGTHSQVNANLATVSATGSTGTVTYAFDTATAATAWLVIDPATGIVSTTSVAVAGTKSVTVLATDATTAPHAASAGVGTVTFTITIN